MASEGVPDLLEALFIYNKAERFDAETKAAIRLCSKRLKNLVDATVVEARVANSDTLSDDVNVLLNTEWHGLKILIISLDCQNRLTELPSALFVKFSRLETLLISYCRALKALPEDIGELSHLKSLQLDSCHSLSALPSSLGKLTALEKITLFDCIDMTVEGLAPLQHLTGLTSLILGSYLNADKLMKYPDFICNLTSLKTLHFSSTSIKTLPAAFGNLTNLEKLAIILFKLEELPKYIGNLNGLNDLSTICSYKLTKLPESLDDLLWRKAHETEESKKMELVDVSNSRNLVLSDKMKQALELMKQNGAAIAWPWDRY